MGMEQFTAHGHILDVVVGHYRADPRVCGLLLGGSNASGTMDFYSDVDLDVVVEDDTFGAVFAERDHAADAAGRPLFRFIADHIPGGEHLYIVLYPTPRGPVKLDVEYHRASAVVPAWWLRRRRLLFDRTGALKHVLAQSADVEMPGPSPERLLDLDQKFWTWCWYTFGKIVRGELWEAVDGLHTMRSRALVQLIAWNAGAPSEGYRRLEQKADQRLQGRLAGTLAPPQRSPLYAALRASMDLYVGLRGPLYARLAIGTKEESERALRAAIEEHWESGT